MNIGIKSDCSDLTKVGLNPQSDVYWNLPPAALVQESISRGMGKLTDLGALAIDTGEFTGRSPKDRFIVIDDLTKDSVWWGDVNIPFDSAKFDALQQKVCDYLQSRNLFVRDAYACADADYRLGIRVVNEFPWSNQFVHNMFLRPTREELINFNPTWTVLNAPGFLATASMDGTRQHNFVIINFTKKIILIGGTAYTGEIKKSIFSVLNFLLPHQKDTLSMHCSANVGTKGDTAIFFGLSGTGKTTLSADGTRKLIGDDEHGWSKNSIFNFEGGCYAKCIGLNPNKEPQIWNAIRFGAILENVTLNADVSVDFEDKSKTENTRVSYPIHHIEHIQEGSKGQNLKNIFFLTADAFGVLPPISKLTKAQAMYHFISGYTAKVAGTEAGITEPTAVFSACFGAPFLPLHPTKYAKMLGDKMDESEVTIWLVNTGWTKGACGEGERIELKYTRAMITAALEGQLNEVSYTQHEVFGLNMPNECPKVPDELLDPRNTWKDKNAYDEKAKALAQKFVENFKQFESEATADMIAVSSQMIAWY